LLLLRNKYFLAEVFPQPFLLGVSSPAGKIISVPPGITQMVLTYTAFLIENFG
jgi:hypothetical protein